MANTSQRSCHLSGIFLAVNAAVILLTGILVTPSHANTAVNFDGINDYLLVPNSASLQDVTDRSFTFAAWVKPQDVPPTNYTTNNNTSAYGAICRPGWHTVIGYKNGGRFFGDFWNSSNAWSGLSSAPVAPGAWHYLCMAIDDVRKQMVLYVDGVAVVGSPRAYSGALKDFGTAPYYIGAGNPPNSNWKLHFKGAIDEARIYNRALSLAEVRAQYNGGRGQYGTSELGLVAGWHLDEGTGNTARDYSGNGNTATLVNGPTWVAGLVNPLAPLPPPADTTRPVLSNVRASNLTATGATVTWTTDESATSQVEYGSTVNYGQGTVPDAALVTGHSVLLTSLTAGTLYHYRVRSKDAVGNEAVGSDVTFTTTPSADTTPPRIEFISPKDGEVLKAPNP